MNGQPVHQVYIPTMINSPPSQPVLIMKNPSYARMDSSSFPKMEESSFPTTRAPGSSPYGGSVASISSSPAEFGIFDDGYQSSSFEEQSYEYNWFPSPVDAGYVGHPLLAASPRSQVGEDFRDARQHNTNSNNYKANSNSGYSTGYYTQH